MRKSTYCNQCKLYICVCDKLKQVQTSIEFVVFRHWKETLRSSNSVRIAALCMPNLRVIEYPSEEAENFKFDNANDILLFPSTSQEASQVSPKRIIVLDGNWKQARRMYKRIQGLSELACVQLHPAVLPPPRIRKPPFDGAMSTMETISQAVKRFETPEQGQALDLNLTHWVHRVCQITGVHGVPKPGQSISDLRVKESYNNE